MPSYIGPAPCKVVVSKSTGTHVGWYHGRCLFAAGRLYVHVYPCTVSLENFIVDGLLQKPLPLMVTEQRENIIAKRDRKINIQFIISNICYIFAMQKYQKLI